MPPSGYSSSQSAHVANFLASCAEALEAESRAFGRSADDGLRKECADIDRALAAGWDDAISEAVMRLTGAFYRTVLEAGPADFTEYQQAVEIALQRVRDSVEAVHI